MFKSVLSVQWKWSRVTLLLLSLALVASALWSVSGTRQRSDDFAPTPLFESLQSGAVWFRLLALVAAFLLAMHAWRTDHSMSHVYAYSLPIARWRFVLYRYAAGAIFALGITVTFLAACTAAVALFGVPAGLRAYPVGLSLRLGIAMLSAYAVFFALWSGTARAGYYTAGAVVGFFLLSILTSGIGFTVLLPVLSAVWKVAGFGAIFGGRWWLIDV